METDQKKWIVVIGVTALVLLILFFWMAKPSVLGLATAQFIRLYAAGNETTLITSHSPADFDVELTKPNNQIFHIVPNVPAGGYADIIWYKNGTTVSNRYNYTFFGTDLLGIYNITASVTDGVERQTLTWNVDLREKKTSEECLGNCCGVMCPDTLLTCPDGYISSCSNQCNGFTGTCGSCLPSCIQITGGISYTAEPDEPAPLSHRTLPCYNVTSASRHQLELSQAELAKWINVPRGYDVILEPFSLSCNGDAIDFTFSIPSRYTDVQVLKCTGNDCFPSVLTTTTSLKCGGRLVGELGREESYIDPKTTPVDIQPVTLDITSFKEALQSGKTAVRFHGEVFEKLRVSLSKPREPIPEAVNPSLKIVGTPLELTVGRTRQPFAAEITLPYTPDNSVREDSLALYVQTPEEKWEYVRGEINAANKTLTASIANIQQYTDENNRTVVAVMGILCTHCINATLERIFMPSPPTRNAVVLVHGLASTPATYKEIIDDISLTNQPFQLWAFAYPSERNITENAVALADLLEAHNENYDQIHLVGHSLGGLVVQQALFHAYQENKRNPPAYGFLPKLKKVILAGAPNEGSPATELYQNLFQYYVNYKTEQGIFNPKSNVVKQLVQGLITPRVTDIDYYVLAGTKPLEFNLLFFKTSTEELFDFFEKNDGLIDVKSAQRIGDSYLNDQCQDYWEINVTHTDLIDNPVSRQIIEKLIAEELLTTTQQVSLLGNNQYFEFRIDSCNPEERYIVIGKELREEEIRDATGCSCGNGYCGIGEDRFNCPSDCLRFFSPEHASKLRPYLLMLVALPLIATIIHYRQSRKKREEEIQKIKSFIRYHYDILLHGGNTFEEILPYLLEEGFSRQSALKYYHSLHHMLRSHHHLLKSHIQSYRSLGHPLKMLKEKLIAHGWHPALVHAAADRDTILPMFRRKQMHARTRKFFDVQKRH